MGPGAGAARRAARHRARPQHAAAGAAAGPARPLRRARAATCRPMPRRSRTIGPAAIKLGQALATRPDLVGEEAARDLAAAAGQPAARAVRADQGGDRAGARAGRSTRSSPRSIPEPVGAASIAQVHRAVTTDGRQVAVKVLRPNIEEDFAARDRDLRMGGGAGRGDGRRGGAAAAAAGRSPTSGNGPTRELDLRREAASASELRENLVAESGFFVPADRLDPHRAAGDDARMDRRHQAHRPRGADRRPATT